MKSSSLLWLRSQRGSWPSGWRCSLEPQPIRSLRSNSVCWTGGNWASCQTCRNKEEIHRSRIITAAHESRSHTCFTKQKRAHQWRTLRRYGWQEAAVRNLFFTVNKHYIWDKCRFLKILNAVSYNKVNTVKFLLIKEIVANMDVVMKII